MTGRSRKGGAEGSLQGVVESFRETRRRARAIHVPLFLIDEVANVWNASGRLRSAWSHAHLPPGRWWPAGPSIEKDLLGLSNRLRVVYGDKKGFEEHLGSLKKTEGPPWKGGDSKGPRGRLELVLELEREFAHYAQPKVFAGNRDWWAENLREAHSDEPAGPSLSRLFRAFAWDSRFWPYHCLWLRETSPARPVKLTLNSCRVLCLRDLEPLKSPLDLLLHDVAWTESTGARDPHDSSTRFDPFPSSIEIWLGRPSRTISHLRFHVDKDPMDSVMERAFAPFLPHLGRVLPRAAEFASWRLSSLEACLERYRKVCDEDGLGRSWDHVGASIEEGDAIEPLYERAGERTTQERVREASRRGEARAGQGRTPPGKA